MIYDVDKVNESVEEQENDVLDNMLEACDYMMNMLGESTAAQRHFGSTSKDYAEYGEIGRKALDQSKQGRLCNKVSDATASNKAIVNHTASKFGKRMHSGEIEEKIDKAINRSGNDMTDREKAEMKVQLMADMRGASGYALAKAAKMSGADVKKAYDKGAEKGDKKRAIKEACLAILSVIDDIE